MYQIKHKVTGEVWKATSHKDIWDKPQHAKLAWNQTYKWHRNTEQPQRFNDNTEYEIVEFVDEGGTRLSRAQFLLRKCLGRCEYDLRKEIEEF